MCVYDFESAIIGGWGAIPAECFAIAVWEVERVRSLFEELKDAIAVWGVEGVRFFASLRLCAKLSVSSVSGVVR